MPTRPPRHKGMGGAKYQTRCAAHPSRLARFAEMPQVSLLGSRTGKYTYEAQVELLRLCAQEGCGKPLERAVVTLSADLRDSHICRRDGARYSIRSARLRATYRRDFRDVAGVIRRNWRYPRSFIGAAIDLAITCERCKASLAMQLRAECVPDDFARTEHAYQKKS